LGRLDAYLKIDITSDEFEEVKRLSKDYDEAFGKILSELRKSKVDLSVANSKLKQAKTERDRNALNSKIAELSDEISSLKSK
jgi:predicted  nucleic acid-binding Zn-ribbon protein